MKAEKTITAPKYVDLISRSEKQIQSEALDLEVQKAKSGLEVTIATTKLDLANAKQRLLKTQCAIPYSVEKEAEATQEVEDYTKGLAFAVKILKERF